MLILTRRIGESVYIGDEVRLTVLGVRGTQVRIGINAPKDVPVHREEIYHKIKQEKAGGAPRAGLGGFGGSGGRPLGGTRPEPGNRRRYDDNAGNYAEPEGPMDDDISPEDPDPHNA